jgi:PmbA protein
MTTEILSTWTDEVRLGIVDSQIDSIRRRTVTETAARVYRDGHVGVASAIGDIDHETLAAQAAAALRFEIPYPPPPARADVSETRSEGTWHGPESLVALIEELLSGLRGEFPGFVFSHSATCTRRVDTVRDDRGRSLRHEQVISEVGIIVKERGSPNIFDTYFTGSHPELTAGGMLEIARTHLTAFMTPAEAPPPRADGRHRIIFPGFSGTIARPLYSDLVARSYATGASMFAGKLGEQLLSPALTIHDTRDWRRHHCKPFDAEGTLRADPDQVIVSGGVLAGIAASRRDAERFQLPATGSALGSLGSTPNSGIFHLEPAPTAPDLAALLGGEPALLVWIESGGDVTRTGDVGAPTMVTLLVDASGQPVGRVAAGTLTGNFYEILGDDFVGVTEQTVSPLSADRFLVTHMALRR